MVENRHEGDLLRAAREEAGLSLREMAELIHFGKTYLGDIETGKERAPLKIIEAYAQVRRSQDMKRRTLLKSLAATPLGLDHDPASAEMALRYGLWLGDQGRLPEADTWYHVATALADRTSDQPTRAYIRARIATRAHYEGWPANRVIDAVQEALAISNNRRVMVEAQAAMVQVHTKAGNVEDARVAGRAMLAAANTADDQVRAAVFINYLECMIGDPRKAMKIYEDLEADLVANKVWYREAQVYLGMAHVRAGDRVGVSTALQAVESLPHEVHMIGVGVSDLLRHVTWDSSDVEALRTFAKV